MDQSFFDFDAHPGHLYVIATLLPLLSFFLLLLWNGTRSWLRRRPAYDPEANNTVTTLYNLMGGDRQNRAGAWLATGAIFLSFCLSLTGFVMFLNDKDVGHHAHGEAH